jgi:mannose-6-phosphate isomerase-like protein (cupin superfamily)
MPHRIVVPGLEGRDGRGVFREVVNDFDARTLVCGEMKAGAVLGNHFHRRTRVFFYLSRGEAEVSTLHVETGEKDRFSLRENEGVVFEVNETHAIRFLRDGEFTMLKSLAYDPADPDTFPHPVGF